MVIRQDTGKQGAIRELRGIPKQCIIKGMKKKYWYRFITEYCPQCGNDSTWKERIYDKPKPEKKQDRYIFKEVWDYCQ